MLDWIYFSDLEPSTEEDWVLVKLKDIANGEDLVPSVAEKRNGIWYSKENENLPLEEYAKVIAWKPLDWEHTSDYVREHYWKKFLTS